MADEGLSEVLGGGGVQLNGNSNGNMNDPLALANSDSPGAQLLAFQFSGSNFLGWSRGIRLAMGAKNKLGFIDGSCEMPPVGTIDGQRWIRADYMVRCWILNSIVSSISESFMCVTSAKEQWTELSERYGQSNAPLIFQLRKELIHITKGDKTIAEYFNKLKRVWDELQSVEGSASCECGAMAACNCQLAKKVLESEGRNRLMQFLVGLGEGYESVCNNILATDTLSTLNKAYSLVLEGKIS